MLTAITNKPFYGDVIPEQHLKYTVTVSWRCSFGYSIYICILKVLSGMRFLHSFPQSLWAMLGWQYLKQSMTTSLWIFSSFILLFNAKYSSYWQSHKITKTKDSHMHENRLTQVYHVPTVVAVWGRRDEAWKLEMWCCRHHSDASPLEVKHHCHWTEKKHF